MIMSACVYVPLLQSVEFVVASCAEHPRVLWHNSNRAKANRRAGNALGAQWRAKQVTRS